MVLPCWVEGVQQLESDPNAYVLMNFSMKYLTISGWFFVGRFFEVLIGARPEPLWKLLSKVGLLYALEPIFTVIFVTNMNTVWEKVMSIVKAQIFRTVLIQKVKFLLCLSSLLAWSFILKCIVYWYAFWSVNPFFFLGCSYAGGVLWPVQGLWLCLIDSFDKRWFYVCWDILVLGLNHAVKPLVQNIILLMRVFNICQLEWHTSNLLWYSWRFSWLYCALYLLLLLITLGVLALSCVICS